MRSCGCDFTIPYMKASSSLHHVLYFHYVKIVIYNIIYNSLLLPFSGFSLRILVAGERCNVTGEYFERGAIGIKIVICIFNVNTLKIQQVLKDTL